MLKTLPAPTAVGPVLASINCPVGTVRVTVDPTATTATAEVRTDDTTGPAADAVAAARITQDGDRLSIWVPEMEGSDEGITTVTTTRRGVRVSQSFGTVTGSVTGVTIRGGKVVIGGGGTVSSGIEVRVTLPAGSGVQMTTRNADLTVVGALAALDLDSSNGSLQTDLIGRAKVRSHNGSADILAIGEWADIETHNGDIHVGTYRGGAARLVTHNGTIDLSAGPAAAGRIEARTHNGDIRLRGVADRSELDVVTRTRNGHVSKR